MSICRAVTPSRVPVKPKIIMRNKYRYGKGIFIAGTDTNVGKTMVTAGIISVMRKQKIDAVPMKRKAAADCAAQVGRGVLR
jgi:hypothetical protein